MSITILWGVITAYTTGRQHHRIKSIFNDFHVLALELSGHCDVISNQLCRHQQNVNRASETRGRYVKIVVFIVIDGFVLSCKKYEIMYVLFWRTLYALTRVLFFVLICCANRDINIKTIVSWVHKAFATRVHTLFYIYPHPRYLLPVTTTQGKI